MKPTKMRNNMIYQAAHHTRSRQCCSALSKDLQKKYGKKSMRVVVGDTVDVVRGEFKSVDGKVGKIDVAKGIVSVEGLKKEQTRGEKYDVYIHASNLVIKSLNTDDDWRIAKLEGKDPRTLKKRTVTKVDGANVPDDDSIEADAGQDDPIEAGEATPDDKDAGKQDVKMESGGESKEDGVKEGDR